MCFFFNTKIPNYLYINYNYYTHYIFYIYIYRLGLERGNSAEEALTVITSLLEKYGQGGPCSEYDDSHFYHNSFLIADCKEAWVLETSGKLWAAEKITSGYRNISNGLTIKTKIDKHSEGLLEKAEGMGLWDGKVCCTLLCFKVNIEVYNFLR